MWVGLNSLACNIFLREGGGRREGVVHSTTQARPKRTYVPSLSLSGGWSNLNSFGADQEPLWGQYIHTACVLIWDRFSTENREEKRIWSPRWGGVKIVRYRPASSVPCKAVAIFFSFGGWFGCHSCVVYVILYFEEGGIDPFWSYSF